MPTISRHFKASCLPLFWVKSLLDQIQSFCVSIPCFPLKSLYIYIWWHPKKVQQVPDFPQQIAALQTSLIFKDVFEDRVNISISNAVHHSNHSAWKILAVKHGVLHFSYCFPIHSPGFSHLFPWISHSYSPWISRVFPRFPPVFLGYIFPKVLPMSFSCSKALSSTRSWPPRPCPPAPAPPAPPRPRRGCGPRSRRRSGDGQRRGDVFLGRWTWGSSEEWSINGKWMVYNL